MHKSIVLLCFNGNMLKKDFEKLIAKKLPETPGIYLFKKGKDLLYVGKATSLKQRVRSYFSNDLMKTRGRLLVEMIALADKVDFKVTDSVLEALILEAQFIKENQPKYNTKDKDNKSYNYVVITDEDFPRVLVVRGRNLQQNTAEVYKYTFGPYPYGGELKESLNLVRKIFPFRDKCVPFEDFEKKQKTKSNYKSHNIRNDINNLTSRPCFNRMIKLCPGVCTGEISKKEYGIQIKNIKMFFEGKKPALLKSLHSQMSNFAKEKEFEKAGRIKKTIFALNHIQDVSLIKSVSYNGTSVNQSKRLESFADNPASIKIESYDIAHMSGKNMVGVMVVSEDGEFLKKQYRKFIIRKYKKANDAGAIEEVVERRFSHTEWSPPTIVVLDGNEVQLKRAYNTWKGQIGLKASFFTSLYLDSMKKVLFCSVVKGRDHKAKDILFVDKKKWNVFNKNSGLTNELLKEQIVKINAESHRFAIVFHKNRRAKNFL